MIRILAVTVMTLRRHIRSRVMWAAGGVTLASLGLSQASIVAVRLAYEGDVSAGELVVSGIMTLSLPFFAMLVSLVAAITVASSIRSDIVEGTVYGVLSKPLARVEYLVGSLLGSVAVLLLTWTAFIVGASAIAALARAPLGAAHYAAIGGYLLPTLVVACAALLFATRFNVWASVALTVLVLGGRGTVHRIATLFDLSADVAGALSFPFPIMNALNGLARRWSQDEIVVSPVLPGVVHLVDYALVLVVLACLSFRRLDLNRTSD